MAGIHDVATLILQRFGPISAMKLQKLCYDVQAWSTVDRANPLFPECFEAWAYGPVSRSCERPGNSRDFSSGGPSRTKPRRDPSARVASIQSP